MKANWKTFALKILLSAPAIAQNPPAQTAPAAPPQTETPDTPGALWVPASSTNFGAANRPVDEAIDMVVIHDIEGSAESAVNWFQNPKAQASAHYVVGAGGQVWQMIKERDVAWHAGNRNINHRSVGIEHEGFAYRPGFYNAVEYEASANLVRSITARYGIPRDRAHIIGHAEVPHPTDPAKFGGASGHTDPGPFWDWDSFLTLVRHDARLEGQNFPAVIHPGETIEAWATLRNSGDDAWPANAGSNEAALREKGSVYLGTAGPANRSSLFFNLKTWTSPRLAAPPSGEVAPGTTGRFVFSLRGPRELGITTEQFRLTQVPVAPKSPVAFGPVLTAVIRVEPWDIVRQSGPNGTSAPAWNGELPISGAWDVYAPNRAARRTARAIYRVAASDGVRTVEVDPRQSGPWHLLGRFRFDDPKTARVELSRPGVIVAGEVRFVGPFPQ